MDYSASLYYADYRKRLPAESHKLWKAGCSAVHILQQIPMSPYAPKSALLSLITLSIYRLMNVPYTFLNIRAYEYSRELLKEVKDNQKPWDKFGWDEKEKKARDQGFRKVIVNLYEHRCSLCGIRMLTPEGHTIVDAAHVKPWNESYDDRPTNGMALCKLCHWSFDEGMMSVSAKYEVLVS